MIWTGKLNDAYRRGGTVGLYDTTLRDGEQTVGVVLDPEEKLEIARLLDGLGIDRIEAGFPRVSQDDWKAVELISAAGLRAEIWGFSRAVPADLEALVELGQGSPGATVPERARVDVEQLPLELRVVGPQLAGAEVLRVVAPVAVGADPDLEERRLVLLDRQVAGGGERLDPGTRPDEREAKRELDPALPACALAVDEAVPQRAGL